MYRCSGAPCRATTAMLATRPLLEFGEFSLESVNGNGHIRLEVLGLGQVSHTFLINSVAPQIEVSELIKRKSGEILHGPPSSTVDAIIAEPKLLKIPNWNLGLP